jgi:dihydroorotase-like cyclic amidohydrolase
MSLVKFPGLIDIHVHLRDPGWTDKEDFRTGTRAAVKGGFTFVVDMPNNPTPTISKYALDEKKKLVSEKAVCDVGFHFGTDGDNLQVFPQIMNDSKVFGLKIYLNQTTGNLIISGESVIKSVYAAWNCDKPILVHAEADMLEKAIYYAREFSRRIHICHISSVRDLEILKKAKKSGQNITTGVTPHHLFLTAQDAEKLGGYGKVKPEIGSQKDRDALWDGLNSGLIDLVESDHAPHTKAEKESGKPPFGMPGLETTFGLMLLSVRQKRLTLDQVRKLLFDHPQKIFNIPADTGEISFDPEIPYIAGADGYDTKCGWSPFNGWHLYGKVREVKIQGKTVLQNPG